MVPYSPIMWVGSKARAVPTLTTLIPEDVTHLVSGFAGGCSLEIALALAGLTVQAYDINPYLVNYWQFQLSQPLILADRIELIHCEFERPYFDRLDRILPALMPLNQAAAFYALVRSAFYNIFPGGSYALGHPNFKEGRIERVRDFRCPGLSVSMQDFRITLSIHPQDFLWLDPVYFKKDRRLYGIKEFAHEELAALLRRHKGRFLLTYNDHPYIRSLYEGYTIIPVNGKWRYSAGGSKESDEIIILNYELSSKQLIESGFDPSRTERSHLTAVSWNGDKKIGADGGSRARFSSDLDAIILSGDSRETLKLIESESVNLIVTSAPYNMQKKYGAAREQRRSLDAYLAEMRPILEELYRILGPRGNFCWQVGNYVEKGEVFPLDIYYYQMLKRLGLRLRNRIVWHFESGLHATKRFSGRYETILWFSKTDDYIFDLDPVRIPAKYPGKKHFKGSRRGQLSCNPLGKNPSDYWDVGSIIKQDWEQLVWNVPNVKANHPEKTIHPCQYPIELVQRLVLALTREGDTVLDPFGGVGSSMIAAISLGRRAIMCEIEAQYIEIARQRLDDYRNGTLRIRPLGKPIYEPRESGKPSPMRSFFYQS